MKDRKPDDDIELILSWLGNENVAKWREAESAQATITRIFTPSKPDENKIETKAIVEHCRSIADNVAKKVLAELQNKKAGEESAFDYIISIKNNIEKSLKARPEIWQNGLLTSYLEKYKARHTEEEAKNKIISEIVEGYLFKIAAEVGGNAKAEKKIENKEKSEEKKAEAEKAKLDKCEKECVGNLIYLASADSILKKSYFRSAYLEAYARYFSGLNPDNSQILQKLRKRLDELKRAAGLFKTNFNKYFNTIVNELDQLSLVIQSEKNPPFSVIQEQVKELYNDLQEHLLAQAKKYVSSSDKKEEKEEKALPPPPSEDRTINGQYLYDVIQRNKLDVLRKKIKEAKQPGEVLKQFNQALLEIGKWPKHTPPIPSEVSSNARLFAYHIKRIIEDGTIEYDKKSAQFPDSYGYQEKLSRTRNQLKEDNVSDHEFKKITKSYKACLNFLNKGESFTPEDFEKFKKEVFENQLKLKTQSQQPVFQQDQKSKTIWGRIWQYISDSIKTTLQNYYPGFLKEPTLTSLSHLTMDEARNYDSKKHEKYEKQSPPSVSSKRQ